MAGTPSGFPSAWSVIPSLLDSVCVVPSEEITHAAEGSLKESDGKCVVTAVSSFALGAGGITTKIAIARATPRLKRTFVPDFFAFRE